MEVNFNYIYYAALLISMPFYFAWILKNLVNNENNIGRFHTFVFNYFPLLKAQILFFFLALAIIFFTKSFLISRLGLSEYSLVSFLIYLIIWILTSVLMLWHILKDHYKFSIYKYLELSILFTALIFFIPIFMLLLFRFNYQRGQGPKSVFLATTAVLVFRSQ